MSTTPSATSSSSPAASTSATATRPPGLYPWFVAITGMLALFVSNGLTATGITIFDPSLLDEFGWSRGLFKVRDLLNLGVAAIIAPFAGILIDRLNPKYLLMLGAALLGLGYVGYSMLTEGAAPPLLQALGLVTVAGLAGMLYIALTRIRGLDGLVAAGIAVVAAAIAAWYYLTRGSNTALGQMYMIHLLFALVLSSAGTMVVIYLVSSWFVRHRGLAIGIALVGTSLGSAVLPRVNPGLIEEFGWRQTYVYNALAPVVLFLLVLLAIKGTPRHAGTTALGQNEAIGDLKQHGLTFAEALRTKTFWMIAASGFLTYYAIFGFVQHAVLHANKGLGLSLREAGGVLFWFSLVAMFSKLASGAIADVIDRHKVFTGCFAIMLLGLIGLASMRADWLLPSAIIIALGWGGLFTLYNMLAVNNFGLREIGRINGNISLLESIGAGLGSVVTGVLFDIYGSYRVPFTAVAVMVAIALVLSTQIRSEVDERALVKA